MSLYKKYAESYRLPVECLIRARRNGRMASSYLLYSDSPRVRDEFSLVIAMIAACRAPENGAPCEKCDVCRLLENGNYTEIYRLTPVGKMRQIQVGDSENPEPNTVRYFENQFHTTSITSLPLKIGIISDADCLNSPSQNALLKTLEEPPASALFILATGNPSALLATTRSRCQMLTLLENHCELNFTGVDRLCQVLHTLYFKAYKNLPLASRCADELIRIAGNLENVAKEETEVEWKARLEQARDFDPIAAKRLAKQAESAALGKYITARGHFLETFRTFFAQLYFLGSGATLGELPNAELFDHLALPVKIDTERAADALEAVEKLLFTLRFNVPEDLAYQTFCLKIALHDS